MMTNLLLQVCAVTLLAATTTQAFSVVPTKAFVSTSTSSSTSAFSLSSSRQQRFQPLLMAASEGSEEEVETTEETEAKAEVVEDLDEAVAELTEPDTEAAEAAEEEEPAEDPELVALKEEIAAMEKTLKERRVQVALTADTADEFSSGGYARKVAEMEQMRKNKRVSTNDDVI
jgi:hypothetical protein